MKKTVYTILITAIIILAQSCKSDMVKENFRFADQQIEYALQLVDSVIQNDNRDDDTKAKNPLVSPRTIDDEGNLKMVRARDWTSGFFPGELW